MKNENELLLAEFSKVAKALGKMFAPTCEVVLHDLTNPDNAIVAIESNLSGRNIGDPTTEIGHARINDRNFPEVIQNYPNRFPDGRAAKSTSIGIKNSKGEYVASLCMNLDISLFASLQHSLSKLIATGNEAPLKENLKAHSAEEIQGVIGRFAAHRNQTPRSLMPRDKRELVKELHRQGFLRLKNAVPVIADCLGISRATVYNYTRYR